MKRMILVIMLCGLAIPVMAETYEQVASTGRIHKVVMVNNAGTILDSVCLSTWTLNYSTCTLAGRFEVRLCNLSISATAYWGFTSDVATTTGIPIYPAPEPCVTIPVRSTLHLYAISGTAEYIRVLQLGQFRRW